MSDFSLMDAYHELSKEALAQESGAPSSEQGVIGDFVDSVQQGAYQGVAGIGETFGLDSVRDWGQQGANEQLETMSRAGQEALNKSIVARDDNGDLSWGEGATDARTWALNIGVMMGQNLDVLAGGGLVKGGRMALTKAANLIRGEVAKKAGKNFNAELSNRVVEGGVKEYARKHGLNLMDNGIAAQAVYGGQAGINMREEVQAMEFSELEQSERFKTLVREIYSQEPEAGQLPILEKARNILADEAANAAQTQPALVASNLFVGGLGASALEGILRGSMHRGAGILAEGITEGVQGGTEQFAANQTRKELINPEQDLWQDVDLAAANEAAIGAGSGGVFAGIGKATEKLLGAKAAAPESAPVAQTQQEVSPEASPEPAAQTTSEQTEKAKPAAEPKELKGRHWEDYFAKRYRPSLEDKVNEDTGEITQEQVKPPYVLTSAGKPFKNEATAYQARAELKLGGDYEITPIDGGFVLSRVEAPTPHDQIFAQLEGNAQQQALSFLEQVKQRKAAGEYVNEAAQEKALTTLLEPMSSQADRQEALDDVLLDPGQAFMRRMQAERVQQKSQAMQADMSERFRAAWQMKVAEDNRAVWDQIEHPPLEADKEPLLVERQAQQAQAQEKADQALAEYEQAQADSPAVDMNQVWAQAEAEQGQAYDKAVNQAHNQAVVDKFQTQFDDNVAGDIADVRESREANRAPEAEPKHTYSAQELVKNLKLKSARKKLKKKLLEGGFAPQLAQRVVQHMATASTQAMMNHINVMGYAPNTAMADALLNAKRAKGMLDKLPQDEQLAHKATLEQALDEVVAPTAEAEQTDSENAAAVQSDLTTPATDEKHLVAQSDLTTVDQGEVFVEPYSEKAIVVRGNTKPHKDKIKQVKGAIFNRKANGWLFSKKREQEVQQLVDSINKGASNDSRDRDNQGADSGDKPQSVSSAESQRGAGRDSGGIRADDSGVPAHRRDGSKEKSGKSRSSENRKKHDAGKKRGGGDSASRDSRGNRENLPGNYRLSADDVPTGSALERAKGNINAIKLALELERDGRYASPVEQSQLARFSGWGHTEIANKLFPGNGERTAKWQSLYDELSDLVSESELKTIQRSTQYAHYTPQPVIDAIYQSLTHFGLDSGIVIEGGMGTGHFVGRAPVDLPLHHVGVEMDAISSLIAKKLYPQSGVVEGDFTKTALPQNFYDAAIGNPPFANITVKNDKRYASKGFVLHDYFMAKQFDAVKPGGLATFVTSAGSMDKADTRWREYMSEKGKLLAAFRLPNSAFDESGTAVVTDVLLFQRDFPGMTRDHSFINTSRAGLGSHKINEYFVANPNHILGRLETTSSQWGEKLTVAKRDDDVGAELSRLIGKLKADVVPFKTNIEEARTKALEAELKPGAREYELYLDEQGEIKQIQDGVGMTAPLRRIHKRGLTKAQEAVVRDYVGLKAATLDLYRDQLAGKDWQTSQQHLHQVYDKFVAQHGAINQAKVITRSDGSSYSQYPVLAAFDMDPEAFRIAALEVEDSETGSWVKGPAFYEKVFGTSGERAIESAMDALAVTLNEKGHVDFEHLMSLYPDATEAAIVTELGDSIYQEPVSGKWVTADEYLSGNVKVKLEQARETAKNNLVYRRNIEALEAVQPDPVELSLIPANMGAHWIPSDIVSEFAKEKLGFSGSVQSVVNGTYSKWIVDGESGESEFSTQRKKSHEILSAALNRKTPKVFDVIYEDNKEKRVINVAETTAANQKVAEIREAFRAWINDTPSAGSQLYDIYNRDFNTTVPRKYDGSHLTLPRLASRYTLRDWQRNVVWRILQNGNTYMAHGVGAGKTLASAVAGFELKRLGLANKPTYVVLKSTLKQFSAEMLDAYPDGKILVADENKLDKKNVRRFMAQLTTEDWDAVVMTHEAFERIPLTPEFLSERIEREIETYREVLDGIDESERVSRKEIERRIEGLESKLEQSQGAEKIDGFYFEETGIDFLFVDEAHIKHKKIPFPTEQSDVKGVDSSGSNKALDLYLKSRYLDQVRPNKNLVLMSGTAITNTLGEAFNIQRYLQESVLEANGISSFDSWSSTFALSQTDLEMAADGTFKPVTRLNRFTGLPGLMRDFLQVVDIVTSEDIAKSTQVKRPTLKGGEPRMVAVESTPEMKTYQAELSDRLAIIEERKGPPKKGDDIVPVVIMDGELASIDLRLVGKKQVGPSKLTTMIDDVFDTWLRDKDKVYYQGGKPEPKTGSTQLIFSDIRQPKRSGFDVYGFIRDELVSKGVPATEIAFIQDANSDKKKRALFKAMNKGEKRILIGGTSNLGTGVNVQQRLVALSDLTTPYMPSELEQRIGRGLRSGNKNDEITLNRYATKGTVDAFKWQLLESKDRMIKQVMSGDFSVNEVEDLGDNANPLAMAKAIASGNPLLLEAAGLEAEVKKLLGMEKAHHDKKFKNYRQATNLKEQHIPLLEEALEHFTALSAKKMKAVQGDNFVAQLGRKKFLSRKEFGEHLAALMMQHQSASKVGSVGGRDIHLVRVNEVSVALQAHDNYSPEQLVTTLDKSLRARFDLRSLKEGSVDIVGLAKQATNQAKLIDEIPGLIEDKLASKQKELERLEALNNEFKYGQELIEKQTRLAKVNRALESGKTSIEAEDSGDIDVVAALPRVAVVDSSPASKRPSLSVAEAGEIIQQLTASWKDRANGFGVAANWDALKLEPKRKKALANAGYDQAAAFFDPASDKTYVNLSQVNSASELEEVIIHELLRHYGVRKLFGNRFHQELKQIYASLGESGLKNLYQKYGIPYQEYSQLYQGQKHRDVLMVDELLAHIQPQDVKPNLRTRLNALVSLITGWLRKHGFNRLLGAYSESELLGIVARARDKVVNTPYQATESGTPVAALSIGRSKQALDAIGAGVRGASLKELKGTFGHKLSDLRKHWLGLLPRRYLTDIANGILPSIKGYMQHAQHMDADRNQYLTDAAHQVDAWRDINGKHTEHRQALAELMHDATIAGVDPSEDYQALRDNIKYDPSNNAFKVEGAGEVLTEKLVREKIKVIKEQIRSRSGEGSAKFLKRIDDLKNRWKQEQNRKREYPALRASFEALPAEMQQMFRDARDAYKAQGEAVKEALLQRAEELEGLDDKSRAALRDRIRLQFESGEVEGPYFPLQRFGDYFALVREPRQNADDKPAVKEFHLFETEKEQMAWVKAQQELGVSDADLEFGKKLDGIDALEKVSPQFVNEVVQLTSELGSAGKELADQVYQLYLQTLPDASARKHFIHRKKTAGFHEDALRAFAHNMFHGAYQLAKLKHGHRMEGALREMKKQIQDAPPESRNRASDLVSEMQKRHEWVMNPKGSAWANKMTSLGFVWYLGLTPAAAVTNLTQTPMLALPVIGSRYGFGKTTKQLLKASKEFIRGGHLEKHLQGEELKAFEEFERSGLIDKSMAHDLAGVAEGGLEYNSTWYKVMSKVSYLFHHAERYNREVTAMAGYRLARASGKSHQAAIQEATDMTLEAHFDYSSSNKARFMQNDAAKVLLIFRQHSLNMTYRLARDFYQVFKGSSPEERQQARRQLGGILGMAFLFAGAAGLPLFSVVGSLLELAFDDEDEPFDFNTEFRLFLAEHLGEEAGRLVAHGALDYTTGATVSSRVGMNGLWLRDSNRELEGRDQVQYYAEQALGPIFGIAMSTGTGLNLMNEGHLERGIESMLPKAIKDGLKGVRYASEGVNTLRGDSVVENLDPKEIAYTLIGFTPAEVAEQYERNNAIKGAEMRLVHRRRLLINRFALARRLGDGQWEEQIKEDIKRFNQKNPKLAIKGDHLVRSMQQRAKLSQKAAKGVLISDKLGHLREDLAF